MLVATILGLALVTVVLRTEGFLTRNGPAARVPLLPPPLPPVDQIRRLTPEQAEAANAAIAASREPIEPARPFLVPAASVVARATALDCLTAAIHYEAASESLQGQRAVAQVVLNRVRHPAFPKSVCGVVYQGSERRTGCQFSFTCDGSLARRPSRASWDRAAIVAAAALNGIVEPSVGTATHYHTIWILPYWADSLTKLTTIGAHIFYRWPGYWGTRAAFTGRYSGDEPDPALFAPAQTDTLPAALPTVPTDAAVAKPSNLFADDAAGTLQPALSATPTQGLPVAEDRQGGRPIADERAGVLRSDGAAKHADAPPAQ